MPNWTSSAKVSRVGLSELTGSDKHVKEAGLSNAVKEGSEQASGDSAKSMFLELEIVLWDRMIRRGSSRSVRLMSRSNDQAVDFEFQN